MKKFFVVFLVLVLAMSFSLTAIAADAPSAKASTAKTYPVGPIQKAERGFSNAVFGWTEIPKRIVDESKASNPVKGLFLGLWQGSCKAFARTASGVVDMATFPVGQYDKPVITPDMPAAK
ncbi:MAG: exosortase system-associated protein, TIGR04073 family [Candidatus Omnitrophica bacterium]|nr:exosortase system-associated protein, TIGR04073 family [Candidatus Omnitrophota bacterium]MDD5487971.1 exosortase system-associated protein, TIGR04073 family [Candidatus Omnitrophota bacterium]